jgi:hypothetical protein
MNRLDNSHRFGWYSLNAYLNDEAEYIHTNVYGQETHCTTTSYINVCPYPIGSIYYKDAVFMGKILNLI